MPCGGFARTIPPSIGASSMTCAAIPTEFVKALTEAGFLGGADSRGVRRLRPAAARRGGDPGRDQRVGLRCEPRPCADVHHGHAAAARKCRAEAALPAEDRVRRAAAAGVRRDRADDGLRHDPAQDARREEGQRPLRRQRSEGLDQPRAALRSHAAAGAHDAARQGEEAIGRAVGVSGRSANGRRQRRGDQADQGADQSQHHRGVLRQSRGAGREPDR